MVGTSENKMVVGTEPAPVPASVPSADPQKDKGGKGNQAWGFQNWNKNKGKGKGGALRGGFRRAYLATGEEIFIHIEE